MESKEHLNASRNKPLTKERKKDLNQTPKRLSVRPSVRPALFVCPSLSVYLFVPLYLSVYFSLSRVWSQWPHVSQ